MQPAPGRARAAVKRLSALGIAIVVLTLIGLALHVPGEGIVGTPAREAALIALMSLQALLYLLAVGLLLRLGSGAGLIWPVIIVAVGIRLPLLVSPPFLSSDINRYVWDGRVQSAGINPYLYVPADPALAALRDHPVYPHINRADYARTIYPPAAQIVFGAVGLLWQSVYAIKGTMVAFEAMAILCLMRLLDIAGLPRSRVLIYAWNPLAAWAFAGNGHVDAVAIGLLALTLLLRVRRHDTFAGATFGAAMLVKFLPVAVAPALWRPRYGWRAAAAAVVTVMALYGLYAGAGRYVLGFLPSYGSEEGLDSGSGLWLLAGIGHFVSLPKLVSVGYLVVAGILLAILGARIATRPGPPIGSAKDVIMVCGNAAMLMAFLTVAISPHYPWYFPWLALPSVLVPHWAVLWLSVAPVVLYINPSGDFFVWASIVYVPAIVLALTGFLGSRWSRGRRPAPVP